MSSQDHEATAKRILPCTCMLTAHDERNRGCAAYYRPSFAAALDERDANALVKAELRVMAERDAGFIRGMAVQREHITELENPMECGHYGANLQPNDEGVDVCMVCAELAQWREGVLSIIDALGGTRPQILSFPAICEVAAKLRAEAGKL